MLDYFILLGLILLVPATIALLMTCSRLWLVNQRLKELRHYGWLVDLGLHETGFLLYKTCSTYKIFVGVRE